MSTLPEGLAPGEIDTLVPEAWPEGRTSTTVLVDIDPELIITQDLCAVCAVDVSDVQDALVNLGCKARLLTLAHAPPRGDRLGWRRWAPPRAGEPLLS